MRKKLVEDYGFEDAELADAGTMGIAMDFAAVLMCYDMLVPEGQTRAKAGNSLASAAARFAEHKDWFSKNYHIMSFLEYMETVLPLFAKKLARVGK